MTSYLCYECGITTTLTKHLDFSSGVPTTDECPVCGEKDDFEYL